MSSGLPITCPNWNAAKSKDLSGRDSTLVAKPEVTSTSGGGSYFVLRGTDFGLPGRFQPPAFVQGVSVDRCET